MSQCFRDICISFGSNFKNTSCQHIQSTTYLFQPPIMFFKFRLS
ncbi:hypothetical protein Leryth_008890 [Lithospermum erythrorhizon]|nr:hypothetical protein Leryth_008890 [Lithospermum erythrorhizon]